MSKTVCFIIMQIKQQTANHIWAHSNTQIMQL